MSGRWRTRVMKLEQAWWQEQHRRWDAMTDEELADQIGPGALEILDSLGLEELERLASGNRDALHQFWDRLESWQEAHQ